MRDGANHRLISFSRSYYAIVFVHLISLLSFQIDGVQSSEQPFSKTSSSSSLSAVLLSSSSRFLLKDSFSHGVVGEKERWKNYSSPTFGLVGNTTCFDGGSDGEEEDDPLACWMRNLKVYLPDETFTKGIFSMSITDLTCSGLIIDKISSSYLPSNPTNNPSLTITLSSMSLTCVGKYRASLTGGTVSITLTSPNSSMTHLSHNHTLSEFYTQKEEKDEDEDAFYLGTQISSIGYYPPDRTTTLASNAPTIILPHQANVTDCTVRLLVPDGGIRFTGSISAKILDLFSGRIAKSVTDAISGMACPAVVQGVEGGFSDELKKLDGFLIGLLDNYTRHDDNDCGDGDGEDDDGEEGEVIWLDWNDLHPIRTGLETTNRFLGNHIDRGVILTTLDRYGWLPSSSSSSCKKEDCGGFFRGINGLIRFLTNGTGDVHYNFTSHNHNETIQLVVPSLGSISLTIHSLNISGVDTLTSLSLLSPISPTTNTTNISIMEDDDNNQVSDDKHNNLLSFTSSLQSQRGFGTSTVISIRIDPIDGGMVKGSSLHEEFTFDFNVDEVTLGVEMGVGYRRDFFDGLEVGDVVDALRGMLEEDEEERLDCLLSGLDALSISSLMVDWHVGSVRIANTDHSHHGHRLEDDLDDLIDNLIALFLNEYDVLVTKSIEAIVGEWVEPYVNQLVKKKIDEWKERKKGNVMDDDGRDDNGGFCRGLVGGVQRDGLKLDVLEGEQQRRFYRFNESSFLYNMNKFIGNSIGHVNGFMSCVASFLQDDTDDDGFGNGSYGGGRGGLTMRERNDVPLSLHGKYWEGMEVVLEKFRIENFGRFDVIDILKPEGRYHIHTELESSTCPNNNHTNTSTSSTHHTNNTPCSTTDNDTAQLSTNLTIHLTIPAAELDATLNLSVGIGHTLSKIGVMILYDVDSYYDLRLGEIIFRPWSLARPLVGGDIYGMGALVDSIDWGFGLEYVIGGGGNSSHEHEIEWWSDGKVNNLGKDVTDELMTGLRLMQDIGNGVGKMVLSRLKSMDELSGIPSLTRDNAGLRQILVGKEDDNGTTTGDDDDAHPREGDVGHTSLMTFYAFLILNAIVLCFYKVSSNQSRRRWAQQQRCTTNDVTPFHHPTKLPSSLMFHRSLSNFNRIFIPLIASLTILLFIVSNISTGASVDIEFTSPMMTSENTTESLLIPSVFTFSLGKTVSEMYHAKVYTLMMLVLVFSGIWPYVKMLLLLLSFIVPQEFYLPLQRREKLLIWLDALGKYSLVDSFVLVLMLVSFKFHIEVEGLGTMDSYVIPDFGFYSFMVATIMSLTFGHGVTHLHRHSTLPQRRGRRQRMSSSSSSDDDNDDDSTTCDWGGKRRESIASHTFTIGNFGEYARFSTMCHVLWFTITLIIATLLIIGVQSKCFVFDFGGLAGVVLGDDSITKHSLVSLGMSIPASVRNPSSFGVRAIRWTYFFFALVMPFMVLVVVTVLYFLPLTLRVQRRVFALAEICNAWSAIEVFLIAVGASLFELSQFAAFMVGHHCDFLQGGWFLGQDTCFDVRSSLQGPGAVGLCMGVVLHCGLVWYTLRLGHRVLAERMVREEEIEPEDCYGVSSSSDILSFLAKSYLGKFLLVGCECDEMVYNQLDDDDDDD